jgi:hypothetical protein
MLFYVYGMVWYYELCEGDGEIRAGCEEFSATNIRGHEASQSKQSVLIFS